MQHSAHSVWILFQQPTQMPQPRVTSDHAVVALVSGKQHVRQFCQVAGRMVENTLLAALANGLVTANWFIAATSMTAFTLLMIRSKTEERFLVERFGDDYCQYRNRTGSVFPKLGG